MRLIQLDVWNFLAIEHASVTFQAGLHFVTGKNWDMGADEEESNGSGKSSIFEAIQWCLFGSLARGKLTADSVVNNVVGKNCRVILTFEHAGRTFVVMRTRKDEEYGNGLEYWIDDIPQTQHRDGDSDTMLLQDLPITEKIFRNAVQVGQSMPDRFLALSEPEKHDLICKIANVSVFDLALARARDSANAASTEAKVIEGTLKNLHEQRAGWVADLEVQKDALRMEEQADGFDLNEVKKVEAHLEAEIQKFEGEISKIVAEISRVDQVREAEAASLAEAQEAVRTGQAEIAARGGDVTTRYNDLLALARQIEQLDTDAQEATEHPERCVLCKKTPEFNAAADCQSLREHLAELADERARVLELYNTRSAEYDPLQKAFVEWQEFTQKWSEVLRQYQDSVNAKISHNGALQSQVELRRQSQARFRADKEKLSGRIQEKEQKLAVLRAKIGQIEATIAGLADQIEQKSRLLSDKDKQARHWKYWVVSIPNLRAAAINKLLEYVNARIDHYMQIMSSGAMGMELYQKAHGQGSRIQVDLRTPGGTYVASSGGERRRVDLAVFLALFDLLQVSSGIHFNTLVVDEIMDGLSPAGVRKLASVLREKADSGMAVYVISHNPSVQQACRFDSVNVVERRGGRANLITLLEPVHV